MKTAKKLSNIYHQFKVRLVGSLFIVTVSIMIFFFAFSILVATFTEEEKITVLNRPKPHVSAEFAKQPIVARALTELIIKVKDENGKPFNRIAPSYGKYMHIFVTNEDFTMYGHDHPDDYQKFTQDLIDNGELRMPILFPKAGVYSLAVKFLTNRNEQVIKLFAATVADEEGEFEALRTPPKKDTRSTKNFNDYLITFSAEPGKMKACQTARLEYFIERRGRAVTDIEPLDSAALTIAAWSDDLNHFISAPAMPDETIPMPSTNPILAASVVFPKPGNYQIFSEFKHRGQIVPAVFSADVDGEPCQ